jgi:hypothetical protein
MTSVQFVVEIENMYGAFTSEGMKKAVINKLSGLAENQIHKLFDTYCRTIPGTYKPDLKNVLDCMDKAGIRSDEKQRTCICCGNTWTSTQIECPRCYYSRDCGDPELYRKEIGNRKAAVARLMAEVFANKIMRNVGGN